MESFTGEQRAFCVKEVYKNNNSCAAVPRLFQEHYKLTHIGQCPSVGLIKTWVENFEGTGSTHLRPTGPPLIYVREELKARLAQGKGKEAAVNKGCKDKDPAVEGVDIKLEPVFDLEETQDADGPPQDMIEISEEIKQEFTGLEVTPDIMVEPRF